MQGIRSGTALAAVVVLIASACQSTPVIDLRDNERLYQSPGYQAKVRVDRTVFMVPVADERDDAARARIDEATAAKIYPIAWMPDTFWARPPVEQLDDLLRAELAESRVFLRLTPRPSAESLVIQPTLLLFRGGREEHPTGRRTIAECAMKITVYGPAGASGDRDKLLERTWPGAAASPLMTEPPTVPMMLGSAVSRMMYEIVSGLDQSNVSRSGVPLSR